VRRLDLARTFASSSGDGADSMTYELPLSQHDILNSHECEKARNQVIALRDCWTQRSDGGGFFTLGAAAYLDAPNRRASYLEAARASNPELCRSFDWLHERVRQFFEDFFGEPVFFDLQYAVPGFHIFVFRGCDQSNDDVAARAHFDLQWMHAMPGHVPAETLSFTLPIEEPSGGATMAIWRYRYEGAVKLRFPAPQYASSHPPQTVTYSRGRIVVHDGLILHAIGRSSAAAPAGLRITMQGHGVKLARGWLLYW
jgi:hypothetical protein